MILIKPWHQAMTVALPIRISVFVQEQGVPENLELDEFDELADHALAFNGAVCVGTARLTRLASGVAQIGRMAVLPDYRRQGLGTQLLQALIKQGQSQGVTRFELHAQVWAIGFYEKQGFIIEGEQYEEAGIPHQTMTLAIHSPL
jgi:predicted GNAT family N-acyltransferase